MSRSSEFAALAGCIGVGALATLIPWLTLGARIDRTLLSPALQIASLWAVWAVCLSRKVPWLSREWSPFAVGVPGSALGMGLANLVFLLVHEPPRGEESWLKFAVGGLLPFFWFTGWFATLAVGFFGGWTLGSVLKTPR
jgi:hypothetical protein